MFSHSFNNAYMNKNEIVNKTLDLSKLEVDKLNREKGYNLYIDYVEYVFENGVNILRIICDSDDDISIDMVSELNELISDKLDQLDYIDEEYYLEVSSAGIEKELRNDDSIKKEIGKYVFVKTYEKVDNQKEFYGYLDSFDGNEIQISYLVKNIKKHIAINKNQIALIRLAIKF